MSETCVLPGCGEPLSARKKRFCCRKHAQKFHNDAREIPLEQQREYATRRRQSDPEAARKRARDYYEKNKDRMAARQNTYYHANKERCKAINAKSAAKAPFQFALSSARGRSKKFGYAFDLDWEWAKSVWTGKCSVTDLAFIKGDGRGPGPFSPTIDRIEASKGYTKDNSRFVLMGVNALKGRGTDADMYAIAEAIIKSKG